jgi:hypothetical protein
MERIMDIILNKNYWDCECLSDYIHSKKELKCSKCNSLADEQPDSRQNEINGAE